MRPNNWQRPIQYAIVGLIFILVVWLFIKLQPLISSLVVAALLAYVLHPLVNIITRQTRLSHKTAVALVYFLFLLLLAAIPAILTPVVIVQTKEFVPDFEFLSKQVNRLSEQSLTFSNFTFSLDTVITDLETSVTQAIAEIATNLGLVLADISTNFLWGLIVLVSVFYLLRDSHKLFDWVMAFVPPAYHRHTKYLLGEIDAVWGSFLRGQLLLMLIVGVMSWFGAMLVGMPGAFIVGLIAGVLDIIPSLGPMLAAVVAGSIALFEGSTYLPVSNVFFAIIILAIFLVIQQIENIWIRPALMGRRLRLHPALVFISVLTSLALFGILVTLLIIPLMATLGILTRYLRDRLRGIDPYPPEFFVSPLKDTADPAD